MAYDFDAWVALAKNDPDSFDLLRQELIESTIQNATGSKRYLRGLQFRIDLERQKANTPLNACIRLSSMMWDSFLNLNEELNELALIRYHVPILEDKSSAKILLFSKF